ncbi:MAG: ribonuclease R [Rhodobacterales bacterium]|nr:ribonuclease R [Rhodobacterales bacterium]
MADSPKSPAPFPSDEQILEFLRDQGGRGGKREIARAFRLDADQKTILKKVLRRLKDEGRLAASRGKRLREPGALPEVTVLTVAGPDVDGEVLARPANWPLAEGDDAPPPVIYMVPDRRGHPALGAGDRVLARLTPAGFNEDGLRQYEATVIRRLPGAVDRVLGLFRRNGKELRIQPVDRRAKGELVVAPGETLDAGHGDLVWAEPVRGRPFGLRQARVVEVVGRMDGPRSISLVAIAAHDIPTRFPQAALDQAAAATAAPLGRRTDLRDLPLVTIDGADARDFDDAVFARPDDDPKNPGGWHLVVAIADVAWYVRPGDPLDKEARKRGNSVYFPDRVVPMLPEALSNGWCSLVPREDRPCLAAHLWIDAKGDLLRHRFERALMRSAARLTYTQVQAARDGAPDEVTGPLVEGVLAPLYGAFRALLKNREGRGALELDLPERRIVMAEDGSVAGVEPRERLDSHKLIEEFMICANVAAAETLEKMRQPCMYRVHDEPSREKLESLREFLDSLDIPLARGQVMRARQFNAILGRVAGTPQSHMVSEVVLRSQAQAEYSPDNIGHFGLALRRYCHFTSPIRRYADLLVHRAIIAGGRLGDGGLADDDEDFAETGQHLSVTERRAAAAERDAVDRFTAAFLADRVGTNFRGRINGVTRFGLFVTLDDSGADGLVPIGTLGDDYYVHDETRHALRGRLSGQEFRLGDRVAVRLVEADPVTGGMIMGLVDDDGDLVSDRIGLRRGPARRPHNAAGPGPGKPKAKGKSKAARRKAAKATSGKVGRRR